MSIAISCPPTLMVSQQLSTLNFPTTWKESDNNTWHVKPLIALESSALMDLTEFS